MKLIQKITVKDVTGRTLTDTNAATRCNQTRPHHKQNCTVVMRLDPGSGDSHRHQSKISFGSDEPARAATQKKEEPETIEIIHLLFSN